VAEHNSPIKVTLFSLRLRARAFLLRSQVFLKKTSRRRSTAIRVARVVSALSFLPRLAPIANSHSSQAVPGSPETDDDMGLDLELAYPDDEVRVLSSRLDIQSPLILDENAFMFLSWSAFL
jgi:hypothetical protein